MDVTAARPQVHFNESRVTVLIRDTDGEYSLELSCTFKCMCTVLFELSCLSLHFQVYTYNSIHVHVHVCVSISCDYTVLCVTRAEIPGTAVANENSTFIGIFCAITKGLLEVDINLSLHTEDDTATGETERVCFCVSERGRGISECVCVCLREREREI